MSDPAAQAAVWTVRRSGIARALGLGAGDAKPLPFIEDPAVPPENLARFARGVRDLLRREELPALWYGHASVGCLHIRPMLDLRAHGAAAKLRRVAEQVADMVAANGGSLSGEHGDGRVRSELLPRMYPGATIDAFGALKRLVDPGRLLNPGVIVDPDPLDDYLRLLASPPIAPQRTAMSFAGEGGLGRAAEACNGNGACRKADGVMCPSYQATGDERHATRGRAVLLRAAMEGRLPGAPGRRRAARGARAVPWLQGLQERVPGAGRHGAPQGGGAGPPVPNPRDAARGPPPRADPRAPARREAAGTPSRRSPPGSRAASPGGRSRGRAASGDRSRPGPPATTSC